MPSTSAARDALVLGGGVIGLACALELAERGLEVTVLERERLGCGASEGNCGLVTPSHALPLNRPGRLRQALRGMLRPDAPLHVRPLAALGLVGWALRFEQACTPQAVARTAAARAALLLSSLELFDAWRASGALECEWEQRGLLLACASEETLAEEAEAARGPLAELRVETRVLDRQELAALEPGLREDLAGGVLYPQDAHLRPEALMRALAARCRERGVRIEEGCKVLALRTRADSVAALDTSAGERRAGTYVLAAGAWSPGLTRVIGLRLPVAPGKGYSLTFPPPERAPRVPLVLAERAVAVTPWPSGLRVGGTMELAGHDASLSAVRLEALRSAARRYLRVDLDAAGPAEEWAGWRPMTPDETPILGRAPRHANLFLATGHGMLGVCTAPASARLVAELVTGTPAHLDPRPYDPGRFL